MYVNIIIRMGKEKMQIRKKKKEKASIIENITCEKKLKLLRIVLIKRKSD